MSGSGWRPHIESALCLSLGSMFKSGLLCAGATTSSIWRWSCKDKEIASIGCDATLSDESGELRLFYTWTPEGEPRDVTCKIRLSSVPAHYGGRRWYMHCPYTQQRALKLYKFDAIEQFCGRTSIHPLPTYASQRVSGVGSIMERRWAIRRKLGDSASNLFDVPNRPKWMRSRTFQRYAYLDAGLAHDEFCALEHQMDRWKRCK